MTSARRRRLTRRRLKAHDLGISNRHNPSVAWLMKRARLHTERQRQKGKE